MSVSKPNKHSSFDQYSKSNPKRRPDSSEERDVLRKKRRKYSSSESEDSLSDDSSSSSNSSSSESSVSSSSSEKGKKKSKKRKKKLKKKEKKLKKKKKLKKTKLKKKLKEKDKKDKSKSKIKEEDKEDSMVGPVPLPGSQEVPDRSKRMAPMTKEEWEKKQSVIRRVYDEATGRHRLIKGDGEVLEEIVSKQRHQEINRQATQGDGTSFQNELATKLGQKAINNKSFS